MAVSDSLARTTVRLECTDGQRSSVGTSFLYRIDGDGDSWTPVLVTNRHVVEGYTTARLVLSQAPDFRTATPADAKTVTINDFQRLVVYHPNDAIDLAAIVIGPVINQIELGPNPINLTAIRESDIIDDDTASQLRYVEDILTVGYPQGLWDSHRNLPLFRGGLTATSPMLDYDNEPKFLIDCSIYPGSSGSPVFLYNSGVVFNSSKNSASLGERTKLLGVVFAVQLYQADGRVTEVTPTAAQAMARVGVPSSLGVVVRAKEILVLIDRVRAQTR